METYQVTFTDTFAGELNYSEVSHYIVDAKDMRHALTLAKKARYISPVPRHDIYHDAGDYLIFHMRGVPVGGEIELFEDETEC